MQTDDGFLREVDPTNRSMTSLPLSAGSLGSVPPKKTTTPNLESNPIRSAKRSHGRRRSHQRAVGTRPLICISIYYYSCVRINRLSLPVTHSNNDLYISTIAKRMKPPNKFDSTVSFYLKTTRYNHTHTQEESPIHNV